MRGFRDGYSDETLTAILKLGRQYGATLCLVESNFGDGTVVALLQKHATGAPDPHGLRGDTGLRQEGGPHPRCSRACDDPAQAHHRSGCRRVRSPVEPGPAPRGEAPKTLAYQMTRLCREKGALKHDDRVDALAMGVAYFTDRLYGQPARGVQEAVSHEAYAEMVKRMEEDPERFCDELVRGGEPLRPSGTCSGSPESPAQGRRQHLGQAQEGHQRPLEASRKACLPWIACRIVPARGQRGLVGPQRGDPRPAPFLLDHPGRG